MGDTLSGLINIDLPYTRNNTLGDFIVAKTTQNESDELLQKITLYLSDFAFYNLLFHINFLKLIISIFRLITYVFIKLYYNFVSLYVNFFKNFA